MLKKLKAFGKKEGYFEIKRIGEFPNASSEGYKHIKTEAINFDAATEGFCRKHDLESVKSCDALDIIDDKNKINFIEFKQLPDDETLTKTIEGFLLPRKIKDSQCVLLNIIRKKDFNFEDKVDEYYKCEKNVIISFHLLSDPRKNFIIGLKYIEIESIIEKQLENNYIEEDNFKWPVFILMTKFDFDYLKYA